MPAAATTISATARPASEIVSMEPFTDRTVPSAWSTTAGSSELALAYPPNNMDSLGRSVGDPQAVPAARELLDVVEASVPGEEQDAPGPTRPVLRRIHLRPDDRSDRRAHARDARGVAGERLILLDQPPRRSDRG